MEALVAKVVRVKQLPGIRIPAQALEALQQRRSPRSPPCFAEVALVASAEVFPLPTAQEEMEVVQSRSSHRNSPSTEGLMPRGQVVTER